MNGTLPQPVRVNVINTDGQRYVIGCVQINSTDLGSETRCVDWAVLFRRVSFLVWSFYQLLHTWQPENRKVNRAVLLCHDPLPISLRPNQMKSQERLVQGHVHELLLLLPLHQPFVYVLSALLLTRQ